MSAQATNFESDTMWKVPGVEECDETSVVVYCSQGQLVEWNGLKLHIHAGSLPKGLQRCTISIKASLAGEYEFPENTRPVSGVFWLRCEPQCTFTKPITVEIQHCSTKRNRSQLKILRAFGSQMPRPYKFKPLGDSFDANTLLYDMKGFSALCTIEENPVSERMYYSQLFYRSYLSDPQRHEIHIPFIWNTELHLNHISRKYPEDRFQAGCHMVVTVVGEEIRLALDTAKWTEIMDGQWKIKPIHQTVTRDDLDNFKPGRGLPSCVLEARPLCEDFPHLLHQIILNGVESPHHEVILSYMPSTTNRDYPSGASVQADVDSQSSTFSEDMSSEQLALWLRNNPSLSGAEYDQDISKLRDAKINGRTFLSLNDSRLEELETSLGFKFTIMDIISWCQRIEGKSAKV